MKIKLNKNYLSTSIEFEIEGSSLKDTLLKASIFTEKDKCSLCGNEDIGLTGNKTKEGHIYIKRSCKCGANSNLGTYKDGSGYFWNKWEVYQGKNNQDVEMPPQNNQPLKPLPPQSEDITSPEELPF